MHYTFLHCEFFDLRIVLCIVYLFLAILQCKLSGVSIAVINLNKLLKRHCYITFANQLS